MNKKKIAETRQAQSAAAEKMDFRNSLLVCVIVLFISTALSFVFSELYQTLGTLAENYSVDIERNGTFLHMLCKTGAPVCFYLTSFLGTFGFFVGAGYICRFAYVGKKEKSFFAAFILVLVMYATNIVGLLGFLIRRMTGESIHLSDPLALAFDFLFLVFRVIVIWYIAGVLTKKQVKPHVYALFSSIFMILCAIALEFADTTLPFFMSGRAEAADFVNLALSYIIYAIHAVFGYIIVKFFFKAIV